VIAEEAVTGAETADDLAGLVRRFRLAA